MHVVVNSLLHAVQSLINVTIFLLFMFSLFSIMGLQSFQGDNYSFCRLTEKPVNATYWPISPFEQRPCNVPGSQGSYDCPEGNYCGHPRDYDITLEADHVERRVLIQYGISTFDNIGQSLLSVFQITTTDNWSQLMFNLMDSSNRYFASAYCQIIVGMGNFFLINMILAVIMQAFNDVFSRKEEEKQKEIEAQEERQRELERKRMENFIIDNNLDEIIYTSIWQKIYYKYILCRGNDIPSDSSEDSFATEQSALKMSSPDSSPEKRINSKGSNYSNVSKASFRSRSKRKIHLKNQEKKKSNENPQFWKDQSSLLSVIPENSKEETRGFLKRSPSMSKTNRQKQSANLDKFILPNGNQPPVQQSTFQRMLSPNRYATVDGNHQALFGLNSSQTPLGNVTPTLLSVPRIGNHRKSDESKDNQVLLTPTSEEKSSEKSNNLGIKRMDSNSSLVSGYSFQSSKSRKLKPSIFKAKPVFLTNKQLEDKIKSGAATLKQRNLLILRKKREEQKKNEKDAYNNMRQRQKTSKSYRKAYRIVSKQSFEAVVILLVLLNTYFLANELICGENIGTIILDFLFYFLFCFEFGLRIHAYGTKYFFFNRFNFYSALIIIFTSIDILFVWVGLAKYYWNLAALLRASRVLRILKMLKLSQKMLNIVKTALAIVKNIKSFTILLLIFVCFYSLLGMELFAYRVRLDENSQVPEEGETSFSYPSSTFNNFYWSFLSVFIVLANDGWSTIYIDHYRTVGSFQSTLYFISLKIFGGYILLNLFLAILLNHYDQESVSQAEIYREEKEQMKRKESLGNYMKEKFYSFTKLKKIKQFFVNFYYKNFRLSPEQQAINEFRKSEIPDINIQSTQDFRRRSRKSIVGQKLENAPLPPPQRTRRRRKAVTVYKSNNSLYCFPREHRFRIFSTRVVKSKSFSYGIIFCIILSTVQLAIESPLSDPDSMKTQILIGFDYGLSVVFALEAFLKIVAMGFINNGEKSYLKNNWNKLDFIIVFFSSLSLLPTTAIDLSAVKVFRLIRVLRPLRVLSRSENLRIAISALLKAVPDMFPVMSVVIIIYIIFAITGHFLFYQKFRDCYVDRQMEQADLYEDQMALVKNLWDCTNMGGVMINTHSHFDDFMSALTSVFHMSTTAGWAEVMYRGIDNTGVDKVRQYQSQPVLGAYFVSIIVVCNYFLYNFFIGVVISSFNREKDNLTSDALGKQELLWLETKMILLKQAPLKKIKRPTNSDLRAKVYDIVTSDRFENFIFLCIIANTISMCLRFYNWDYDALEERINNVFLLFFVGEFVLKFFAFDLKYFTEAWNIFDFSVIIASGVSYYLTVKFPSLTIGSSATVFRSIKLGRLIKLVKKNKSLVVIFQTFIQTIPQLFNAGLLLSLFLFMYAVFGMYLFAHVKWNEPLNNHLNFTEINSALLLLFRVSTGENWQKVVYAISEEKSIQNFCLENPDYSDYLKNDHQTLGCGSGFQARIYFISFILVVSMIFLNLFIAIILQSFEDATQRYSKAFTSEMTDKFLQCWSNYDEDGQGFIRIKDFDQFMLSLGHPLGWDIFQVQDRDFKQDFLQNKMELQIFDLQSKAAHTYTFDEILNSLALNYIIEKLLDDEKKDEEDKKRYKKAMQQKDKHMRKQTVKHSEVESSVENFDDEMRAKKYMILRKELQAGEKNKKSIAASLMMKKQAEKDKVWNARIDKMKALEQIRIVNKNKVAKIIDKQLKKSVNIDNSQAGGEQSEIASPAKRTTSNLTQRLSNNLLNTLNKLAAERNNGQNFESMKLQARGTLKVASSNFGLSNNLGRRGSQKQNESRFDREQLGRKVSLGVEKLTGTTAEQIKKKTTLAAKVVQQIQERSSESTFKTSSSIGNSVRSKAQANPRSRNASQGRKEKRSILQSSKTENQFLSNTSTIPLKVPDPKPVMVSGEFRSIEEELKIQQNYPSPTYIKKTEEELESNNDEKYDDSSSDETEDNGDEPEQLYLEPSVTKKTTVQQNKGPFSGKQTTFEQNTFTESKKEQKLDAISPAGKQSFISKPSNSYISKPSAKSRTSKRSSFRDVHRLSVRITEMENELGFKEEEEEEKKEELYVAKEVDEEDIIPKMINPVFHQKTATQNAIADSVRDLEDEILKDLNSPSTSLIQEEKPIEQKVQQKKKAPKKKKKAVLDKGLIDDIKKYGFDFSSDEERDDIFALESKTEMKQHKYQIDQLDSGRDMNTNRGLIQKRSSEVSTQKTGNHHAIISQTTAPKLYDKALKHRDVFSQLEADF